jgi:hypothetical protein
MDLMVSSLADLMSMLIGHLTLKKTLMLIDRMPGLAESPATRSRTSFQTALVITTMIKMTRLR